MGTESLILGSVREMIKVDKAYLAETSVDVFVYPRKETGTTLMAHESCCGKESMLGLTVLSRLITLANLISPPSKGPYLWHLLFLAETHCKRLHYCALIYCIRRWRSSTVVLAE